MQNEIMTSAQNVVLSGRSVDEITADIRVNYRNAKASIVAIGRDLAEVKQMLNHGEWLPYLQGLNISVSSAENYMRYAAEVPGNDQLAALPYSAAIALIALPEDEREQFMQDNDIEDKSAAEIKRLIAATKQEAEKRKKAEEALSQAQLDLHQAQTVLSVAERGRDAYKEQLDKAQEKWSTSKRNLTGSRTSRKKRKSSKRWLRPLVMNKCNATSIPCANAAKKLKKLLLKLKNGLLLRLLMRNGRRFSSLTPPIRMKKPGTD